MAHLTNLLIHGISDAKSIKASQFLTQILSSTLTHSNLFPVCSSCFMYNQHAFKFNTDEKYDIRKN